MEKKERTTEAGYLYGLTHPSDPSLYKVGKTTRHPEDRLAEHNNRYEEYTGKIVKETGQKWELKTYISVPDTYWAEAVFWGATGLADIPYRRGIEVERMDWKCVFAALEAVKKAGVRPLPRSLDDYVYVYRVWMNKRLKGRGIRLLGHIRSKYGKSNFRCDDGHEWRTVPNKVAEGEGCPQCGFGKRTPEEIKRAIIVGVLCLLVDPNKPGWIKIGLTYGSLEQAWDKNLWGDWQVHRYRHVEEPGLAESLNWESLGYPQPNSEAINIDLSAAEELFCTMHYRLESEIAMVEKAKDISTA
ncbi:MAG: GIY-YIG nuclease family protein [Bdellovibrio sp.]|nr:GIY-YIG nuclease family protein [Bdellovibrio sp.]